MGVTAEDKQVRRRRTTLVLVLVVFTLPLVVAWVLYATINYWHPQPTASHGDLVTPARPVEGLMLEEQGTGRTLDESYLRGKWTFVYIASADCGPVCEQALYYGRQVRIALHKDMGRVQRLLVMLEPLSPVALEELQRLHPQLTVASVSSQRASSFLGQFQVEAPAPQFPPNAKRLYLVDPLGNLMMSYPPESDPKGLLKDLQRLLRISRIG
jgi:cytochrome oxidase Cu insertion factor (SCO1/SenC/PrrC family)